MRFVVEPGEFQVMVGSSSEDVIQTKFEVKWRTDLSGPLLLGPRASRPHRAASAKS